MKHFLPLITRVWDQCCRKKLILLIRFTENSAKMVAKELASSRFSDEYRSKISFFRQHLSKTRVLIIACLLTMSVIQADVESGGYLLQKSELSEVKRPLSVIVNAESMLNSKIHRHQTSSHNHHLKYGIANAELGAELYNNDCYPEWVTGKLGYTLTQFDWDTNPYFAQTYFHTAYASISGVTSRIKNWSLQGELVANIDADTWNFNDYFTWDALLWGRYSYNKYFGIHIGMIVESGMKVNWFYPIIGIDLQLNRRWNLSLVYPVDIALTYAWDCNWSVSMAGRLINNRQRASKNELIKKAIFTYRTAGGECAIHYSSDTIIASVHAGYTLESKVTLANEHNKYKQHYYVNPTGYFGGEVVFNF